METVGVKELRDGLSHILQRVEKGQIFRVQRHGKDIVELRPVEMSPEQELVNRLRHRGLMAGGSGRISHKIRTVRNRRPDRPISDLVREERR